MGSVRERVRAGIRGRSKGRRDVIEARPPWGGSQVILPKSPPFLFRDIAKVYRQVVGLEGSMCTVLAIAGGYHKHRALFISDAQVVLKLKHSKSGQIRTSVECELKIGWFEYKCT